MMTIEKYHSICEIEAGKLGVSAEIHPEDMIFRYVLEHPLYQSKEEQAVEYYFQNGYDSALKLQDLLKSICGFGEDPKIRLLEFASGYGCVTRHLINVFPSADITACDIHPQAIHFIEEKIGTAAILSSSHPEDLVLDQKYDVVFALSFFSHMPKNTFHRWLDQLFLLTKPGGFLIFTTHGIQSKKLMPMGVFDEDGFYFLPISEQKDLNLDEYGTAYTVPKYVFTKIANEPNRDLIYFHEAHWWANQDVYIVKRIEEEESQQSDSRNEEQLSRISSNTSPGKMKFFKRVRAILAPPGSRREQIGRFLKRRIHFRD